MVSFFQYVLQEHNYVALPPASPPLSPMLHHNAGGKLNGAQSSASPSSLNSDTLPQHHSQHHALHHGQLASHNQQNKGKCSVIKAMFFLLQYPVKSIIQSTN